MRPVSVLFPGPSKSLVNHLTAMPHPCCWRPCAAVLQIYGAMALPVLLAVGIGVNLVGWNRAHINVPLVFYFDSRTMVDFRQYLEIPTFFLCTLAYCLWLSFTVVSNTISPQVWPLVWLFSTIAVLFNPAPVFHKSARWWIIRSTLRVITAGLVRVEVSSLPCSYIGTRAFSRLNGFCSSSSETSGLATNSAASTTPPSTLASSSVHTPTTSHRTLAAPARPTGHGPRLFWLLCRISGVSGSLSDVTLIRVK